MNKINLFIYLVMKFKNFFKIKKQKTEQIKNKRQSWSPDSFSRSEFMFTDTKKVKKDSITQDSLHIEDISSIYSQFYFDDESVENSNLKKSNQADKKETYNAKNAKKSDHADKKETYYNAKIDKKSDHADKKETYYDAKNDTKSDHDTSENNYHDKKENVFSDVDENKLLHNSIVFNEFRDINNLDSFVFKEFKNVHTCICICKCNNKIFINDIGLEFRCNQCGEELNIGQKILILTEIINNCKNKITNIENTLNNKTCEIENINKYIIDYNNKIQHLNIKKTFSKNMLNLIINNYCV